MSFLAGILPYVQVGVAILLVGAILLQQRGSGLSAAFGGEGNIYRTKRGLEKTLFTATIILSALFLILAFINLLAR
ncbi:preprotein translocase subunit SecG [Candidatus Giovannonibacteria bacterium]|nr:preprotein translocase subunit SecG [Candidatus Giovannonibacteria bacterium]